MWIIKQEWAYKMHCNLSIHNDCTLEGIAGVEEISDKHTQDPQEYKYLVININPKQIPQRNPRDQDIKYI